MNDSRARMRMNIHCSRTTQSQRLKCSSLMYNVGFTASVKSMCGPPTAVTVAAAIADNMRLLLLLHLILPHGYYRLSARERFTDVNFLK